MNLKLRLYTGIVTLGVLLGGVSLNNPKAQELNDIKITTVQDSSVKSEDIEGLKKLEGQLAIRTGPTEMGDWSKTSDLSEVISVNQNGIAVKNTLQGVMILDDSYIDNQWVSLDEMLEEMDYVGKLAYKTNPTNLGNGNKDNSYVGQIDVVDPSHKVIVLYQSETQMILYHTSILDERCLQQGKLQPCDMLSIIDRRYIDDSWVYGEAYNTPFDTKEAVKEGLISQYTIPLKERMQNILPSNDQSVNSKFEKYRTPVRC